MNVRELKTILEHVPDDLPVVIHSSGYGLMHIRWVERSIDGSATRDKPWPAVLKLEDGSWWMGRHLWFAPEPTYELHGPFRRKPEMLRALDVLEGAPA